LTGPTVQEEDRIHKIIGFEIPYGEEWVKDWHVRYWPSPPGKKGWCHVNCDVPEWWKMAITYWWNYRPFRVRPYYQQLVDDDFFKELYYISQVVNFQKKRLHFHD
jgi:hypothetical protein